MLQLLVERNACVLRATLLQLGAALGPIERTLARPGGQWPWKGVIMTVSMTGTRVGSLRPAVTASPPVGRRLLASVQMAAPRRRWAACRSSLRDHTDIDSSSKAGKYGKPSIAPGAEGLDDVLERELRSERSRKSLVAAEVEPEQERLGVMATLSFDEAATAPSQLPMAGAVRRIVKSDIVLLLDILGTLLLCACFALDTLPLNEFERVSAAS